MRVTALILATIGGVFGILFGMFAMGAGAAANAFDEGVGNAVVGLGLSAIAAAVAGIIAAGIYFSGRRERLMAWVLILAALWRLVSISFFAIPGFLLLLLAGIFAFLGRTKPTASQPAEIG